MPPMTACMAIKTILHFRAWELTGGGEKWRAVHMGPILGLTGAQAVVWWPSYGDEVVA
jgi:hypothetical protein